MKLIIFKGFFGILFLIMPGFISAQTFLEANPTAQKWADNTASKLSRKQKIAQLMVIRVSEMQNGNVVFFDKQLEKDILKYNIGAICLFQGTAVEQAKILNKLQQKAKTPLMVCIDGETGLGMRFSDVETFPYQLTIGATNQPKLAYAVGNAIAKQCLRAGIQVNYAPVVDINNNPENPIINVRSFGEDKKKVTLFGVQMMKGMQDFGVMACAKHFPGHGDVSVDSHLDLPVILKSKTQLDALELYPFKSMIKEGVGSMMVAHLYIPSIDTTKNQATSLSHKNVTDLLKQELRFKGLIFTDALEMKGVAKFYPQGKAVTQSLIAGNDMLCLPGDIKGSIKDVKRAIREGKLSWADIDAKVNKVLLAKYNLKLAQFTPIDTANITTDLNKDVNELKLKVYGQAITLLKHDTAIKLPLTKQKRIAYVGFGIASGNQLAKLLNVNVNADCFYLDYKAGQAKADSLLAQIGNNYDVVINGLHQYQKYPANNFGISNEALNLFNKLAKKPNSISFIFGNPYAIAKIVDARSLVACYEDDELMHQVVFDFLTGKLKPQGILPVSVSKEFSYGFGIAKR
ncbi:MAG: glycoside hydrolase family 3 [Flavobacterium sp.]|nr:glycoside hydrolase family 3 [Pedobacter sp.]